MWEVRYREGRHHRSKTFDHKQDARSFEAGARVRHQRGEHVRRSSDTPTLRDFAADWMGHRRAAGLSEATLTTNGLIFDTSRTPFDPLPTVFVATCEAKPGTRLELVTPSLPWKCSTN
jgi:hypothetical protein